MQHRHIRFADAGMIHSQVFSVRSKANNFLFLLTLVNVPMGAIAETQVGGSISVGYSYDDNVSVDEIETSSGRGDQAVEYGARLELKHSFTTALKTTLSASHTSTNYREFSALDRDTNAFSGNVAYDFSKTSASVNYFYINARIDGSDFLTYQRVSPAISFFTGKQWYWRLAYVSGNKDFETRRGRSATISGYEIDSYYFLQGLKSYFNFGVTTREEDSLAANYDYDSYSIKARWTNRFQWLDRDAKFELSIKYEDRDYLARSWGISELRSDQRLRTRARLTLETWKDTKLQMFVSYNDYTSNLPTADYEQQVAGLKFIYDF